MKSIRLIAFNPLAVPESEKDSLKLKPVQEVVLVVAEIGYEQTSAGQTSKVERLESFRFAADLEALGGMRESLSKAIDALEAMDAKLNPTQNK